MPSTLPINQNHAGWLIIIALAVPAAVVAISEPTDKTLLETVRWGAAYWKGEIVFAEQQLPFDRSIVFPTETRIMALDPQTGVVRPTEISVLDVRWLLADAERLWIIGTNEIVEADGTTLKQHKTALANSEISFLLDGQLTSIASGANGRISHLYALVDGQWQRRQQIVMPRGHSSTRVLQIGNNVHIVSDIYYAGTIRHIYRMGFGFTTDALDLPSAIEPENTKPNIDGWVELDTQLNRRILRPANILGELHLAGSWGSPMIWKLVPMQPGHFQPVDSIVRLKNRSIEVVASPTDATVYLVAKSKHSKLNVFQLTDDHFELLPFSVPGLDDEVVATERSAILKLIVTSMFSTFIMLGGALILARRNADYSYGRSVVALGPLSRRWLARGVDLSIQWMPALILGFWAMSLTETEPLFEWQRIVASGLQKFPVSDSLLPLAKIPVTDEGAAWFRVACAWVIAWFVITVATQARWGATLGKWLFGLRVVRTTLSRCGLARVLYRELTLYLDTLFLLTPIPGVWKILTSERRQRMGDQLADTIVIDARSSREMPRPIPNKGFPVAQ